MLLTARRRPPSPTLWIIAVSLESSQTTHRSARVCVLRAFIYERLGRNSGGFRHGNAIQPTRQRTIAKVLRYRNTCFCKSEAVSRRALKAPKACAFSARSVIRSRIPATNGFVFSPPISTATIAKVHTDSRHYATLLTLKFTDDHGGETRVKKMKASDRTLSCSLKICKCKNICTSLLIPLILSFFISLVGEIPRNCLEKA